MSLKPLGDHLIIKTFTEEKRDGGIILPESEKGRPERGEVVAVGPGRKQDDGNRISMSVKVGDKVVFRKYSGDEIEERGEKLLVLSESDVIAIVE